MLLAASLTVIFVLQQLPATAPPTTDSPKSKSNPRGRSPVGGKLNSRTARALDARTAVLVRRSVGTTTPMQVK